MTDTDGDGLITFRDLNAPANAAFVTDLNGNGYIDGGDLLNDSRWENGLDEDDNGKVDDLVGWDFQDNDNDPMPVDWRDHGTGMAEAHRRHWEQWHRRRPASMWQVSMMPVRIHPDG